MTWSATRKKMLASTTMTSTMTVEMAVSRRLGQTTFAASARTCWRNVKGLVLSATKKLTGYRHAKLFPARRALERAT